jgi:hypothetical protein
MPYVKYGTKHDHSPREGMTYGILSCRIVGIKTHCGCEVDG